MPFIFSSRFQPRFSPTSTQQFSISHASACLLTLDSRLPFCLPKARNKFFYRPIISERFAFVSVLISAVDASERWTLTQGRAFMVQLKSIFLAQK